MFLHEAHGIFPLFNVDLDYEDTRGRRLGLFTAE